jgi:hypothetical protein
MRRLLSLTVLASAVLLAGCGRTMQTPPPLQPVTPGTTSPGYTNTYPGYNNGYPGYNNGMPGYNNGMPGYGQDPNNYDPNNGTITAPMIAKIENQKNGSVLGIGTFTVNVSVSNPAGQPQQGRLKVSILDNGESIRDFTEVVTVPAGQTITRTYSDKRWIADNATASVQTLGPNDPYATGMSQNYNSSGPTNYYDPNSAGTGYGSGYPSSGYGSGYDSGYGANTGYGGSYPSSGYGSGYGSNTGYGSSYPSSGYGYPSSNSTAYPY